MAIQPIEKKSISREVLDQIKGHIISGEWAPGTKIPGELELMRRFGVSRISVREAIHRLAGMGVLSVRRGEGTFVTEMLPQQYFNSLLPMLMIEGASLVEILEFRAMIEIESARLAAMRADTDDLRRLEEITGRMGELRGRHEEFALQDLNFHAAIALATHNRVIIKVNAIIHDMLKHAMEEIVRVSGFEGGMYYHAKILEAIRRKDADSAAGVMEEHIRATIRKMIEVQDSGG